MLVSAMLGLCASILQHSRDVSSEPPIGALPSSIPAEPMVPESTGLEVHGNVLGMGGSCKSTPNSKVCLASCARMQNGSVIIVNESACHFPRIKGTGIGWVRNEFQWVNIERQPGRYDFSLYDAQIQALKDDGIKVLVILGGCGGCDNPLYNVSTTFGRQGFVNYTKTVASHLEELYPGGIALELWNEPVNSWQYPREATLQPPNDASLPPFNALAQSVGIALSKLPRKTPLFAPGAWPHWGFLEGFINSSALEHLAGFSVHPCKYDSVLVSTLRSRMNNSIMQNH